MSQSYATAMGEVPPIVSSNPFAALELPAITPHTIDYFEHDEAEALFDAIEQLSGEAARTVVERGCGWACVRVNCSGCTDTASTGCAAQWKSST